MSGFTTVVTYVIIFIIIQHLYLVRTCGFGVHYLVILRACETNSQENIFTISYEYCFDQSQLFVTFGMIPISGIIALEQRFPTFILATPPWTTFPPP